MFPVHLVFIRVNVAVHPDDATHLDRANFQEVLVRDLHYSNLCDALGRDLYD